MMAMVLTECVQSQIVAGVVTLCTAIIVAFTIKWDRSNRQ
jgi:hypothetical protein